MNTTARRANIFARKKSKFNGVSNMHSNNLIWLTLFLFFIVLDFVIPYTLLRDVSNFFGAYFFWVMITVTVVVSAMIYMRRWKDEEAF